MSKFAKGGDTLDRLVENSFKAIDAGKYEIRRTIIHDAINIKNAIFSCSHAPMITEVKFSSPSRGQIRMSGTEVEVAKTMVESGAAGLSILTQPYLFDGSINNLIAVRKAVSVPLLMKDIIVSEVQIDAAKQTGADCILLIRSVFDRNLAESDMDRLFAYATKKGLQVLVEAHSEKEYVESIKENYELVGINNRNLADLKVDISQTERLIKSHGKGRSVIVSESGISKPADIQYLRKAGADAFLVGTSIMEADDIGAKVSELYVAL